MKFFAIIAVAALALSACSEIKNEDTVVPVDESSASILYDDGSVRPSDVASQPVGEGVK